MTLEHVRFAALALAPPPDTDTEPGPLLLSGLVVPWDVTVPLNRYGDTVAFGRGSVRPTTAGRVKLLLEHRPEQPFGYGVEFVDTPEGLRGTFAIPRDELDDPAVAKAVRGMRNGVRDGLSGGFDIDAADVSEGAERGTQHYAVTAARLFETSSVALPRFDDARHAPLAAAALTPVDPDDPDEEEETDDDEEGTDDMATATDDQAEADRVAAHRLATTTTHPAPPTTVTARRTMGQFAWDLLNEQGRDRRDTARFQRLTAALTDELVADVPGLVHDAWVSSVVSIVAVNTPTVQAFRRIPLPPSGMAVHIPVVRNAPPLGQQTTEKTAVATGKLSVTPASLDVNTYAGGQDISLATLMRSDPSYLQVLMAEWAKEVAGQMEQLAATTVAAGATAGGTWPTAADDMGDPFVDVAATMLGSIGRMPEVAVLAPDVWAVMAKTKDSTGRPLFPAAFPANPAGSTDVTSPVGSVSGLVFYVSSQLPAGTAVVGVSDAFATLIGQTVVLGPVDNVELAGRDVGIAVFAAAGIIDARGVFKITGTLPTPTVAASTSKK